MAKGLKSGALGLLLASVLAFSAQSDKQQNQRATSAAARTSEAKVPAAYVIAPDDVLDVDVWKEPEISAKSLPVRPDGKISIALLNDVQAAGLTATELAASITEKLKKYVSEPQVTVIVTQANSQRIYITGEVNHGGGFPLLPGMTVLQALAGAGGLTQFANTKKVYVLRTENGKDVKYPFNYSKAIKGEDLGQNIVLKPGDTIVVP